jgi:hypothetical protein
LNRKPCLSKYANAPTKRKSAMPVVQGYGVGDMGDKLEYRHWRRKATYYHARIMCEMRNQDRLEGRMMPLLHQQLTKPVNINRHGSKSTNATHEKALKTSETGER